MNGDAKSWHAVDATSVREACEAIEYGLMEAGAQGTETNESRANVTVTGYFGPTSEDGPEMEAVRSALLDALKIYSLGSASLIDLKTREVPDRDWLAEWKKDWQPVEVGRFIIAPPWSEITDAPARIVIRIEPGMAFGTGTH